MYRQIFINILMLYRAYIYIYVYVYIYIQTHTCMYSTHMCICAYTVGGVVLCECVYVSLSIQIERKRGGRYDSLCFRHYSTGSNLFVDLFIHTSALYMYMYIYIYIYTCIKTQLEINCNASDS